MPAKKKVDTWMPFLIDKYLGDTTDLTTEQHGAYFLLLLAMWKKGGSLVDDDKQLRQITRLDPGKWRANREILRGFFRIHDGKLTQKRLTIELVAARKRSDAKSEAGVKGAARRWQGDGSPDGSEHGTDDDELHGKPDGSEDGKPDGTAIAEVVAEGVANASRIDASISTSISIPIPPPESPSGSEAIASGADAPAGQQGELPAIPPAPPPPKPSEQELTKRELWRAGKSLLREQGMAEDQCGSFIGGLVKTYGSEVVVNAVRTAVVERPVQAEEYLIGVCKQRAARPAPGGRRTLTSDERARANAESTQAAMRKIAAGDVVDV